MSYCRWSCDAFASDVYVYEGLGGWIIHVASQRIVNRKGAPREPRGEVSAEKFFDYYDKLHKWLETNPRKASLDHPAAGQTFICETPGDCAEKLAELRSGGLHVPEGVIEALLEEQHECENAGESQ